MISLTVRPASTADLEAMVAIYNDVLETSFAIWNERPSSMSERRVWLNDTTTLGYPVLVAEAASGVLGFVAAGPFRAWPGYDTTAEHSIHVRRDARGDGVGTHLLTCLEAALARRRTHIMVAGIDAGNDGSLRFHHRAGFREVGRMPQVGWMRGSWRDLVLVQKTVRP